LHPTVPSSVIVDTLPNAYAEIWFGAIETFMSQRPAGKLFDLLETDALVAWRSEKRIEPT